MNHDTYPMRPPIIQAVPEIGIEQKLLQAQALAAKLEAADGQEAYPTANVSDIQPSEFGTLLGHAALRDDAQGTEALARLYIYRRPPIYTDNLLSAALLVLITENRSDLFSTLVRRFQTTCEQVWIDDVAQRGQMLRALRTTRFPDEQELDAEVIESICTRRSTDGTRGLAAWFVSKSSLIKAFHDGPFTESDEFYLSMTQASHDVLRDIEETRAWTAPILYMAMQQLPSGGFPIGRPWQAIVQDMAQYLPDRAAARLVRSLADEVVRRAVPSGLEAEARATIGRLSSRIIEQRPHITLGQWLYPGATGELTPWRTLARGGKHNSAIRDDLNTAPAEATRCRDDRLGSLLAGYDQVVTWVGADRGGELGPVAVYVLETLMRRDAQARYSQPAAALRAALDLRVLRNITAPDESPKTALPPGNRGQRKPLM